MFVKITSPDKIIFEWKVKKIIIPTESWEIWVLPWHIPLVSVVKPWIVKLLLEDNTDNNSFIKDSDFLFENDFLNISVSKWLVYIDWDNIVLAVSSGDSSIDNTEEELENMKRNLENQIEKIKTTWNIEDMEKIMVQIQKISADLKLIRKKWVVKG